MADTGTFDAWITDRLPFQTAPPKESSTGDFEIWIDNDTHFHDYVAAGQALPPLAMYYKRRRK